MKKKLPGETEFIEEFSNVDDDGVQVSSTLDERGREVPDPVPMAPPVGYDQPDPLEVMIRRMIQQEDFRKALASQDLETFEEADDFDIPDDPLDPAAPYEVRFDPPGRPVSQPGEAKGGGSGETQPPPPPNPSPDPAGKPAGSNPSQNSPGQGQNPPAGGQVAHTST